MEVYLIRHGETDGNRAGRHQHPDTPLNDKGKEQARRVATVLKERQVTHLVSSSLTRALMTTKVIAEATDLTPETPECFIEMVRPTYLVGNRRLGWATIKYIALWYFGYQPASMHDGESYTDFRTRLNEARTYLEAYPDDAVVGSGLTCGVYSLLRDPSQES